MNDHLLLRLPHRQFVFTLPKVLRLFFRHDKRLHGEISRLVYGLVQDFSTAAAGKPIRTAAVVVFQSSGQFARWNPHWHGLFVEGGFDQQGRFLHVPTVNLAKISACLRQTVIGFFLERKLRTDTKIFPVVEFLVELLQHLPDSRSQLLRTYGLYSSRARGTWARSPHLLRLAPEGWKRDHPPQPSLRIGPPEEPRPELSVSAKQSRAACRRYPPKTPGGGAG